MVALVIAAVGSFVSCKDYDDDINNLQKQIDAKAALSELTALQSTLDSKIAAAQSAATAAQATADAAATKTAVADLKTALESAIADAKKAGTDAGTKAGDAIAAANKAQETAEGAAQAAKDADAAAKAALADALKTIEETYQTKAEAADAAKEAADALAAVKTIAEAAYTKAEAEKLQEQVNNLKSDLESSIEEKVKEAIKDVENAKASVDAIWSAVTSVELFARQNAGWTVSGEKFELLFLTGEEVDNVFGGLDNTKSNDFQVAYQDGEELRGDITEAPEYKDGREIEFTNRIIIRVNPANAEVKPEDIKLINSLGETDINDLITVTKVEDYKQLITRADNVNTGLKVVTIVRKKDVKDSQFEDPTNGPEIDYEDGPTMVQGKTAFALGINNSKDAAENRFAYTTFDLGVTYGVYDPMNGLNFWVKGDEAEENEKSIANLHNRYDGNKLIGEDETKETPDGKKWFRDYAWVAKNETKGIITPAVDTLSQDGKGKNANYTANANAEKRHGKAGYVITDGKTRSFTIYPKTAAGNRLATDNWNYVQYYYVTLDKFAAVESSPSEYQAWKKYDYTGLYTITPATDNLTITVNTEKATGDIVGFRLFAVNFDGTLVDPDGRAFYVKLGKPAAAATPKITASYEARIARGVVPTAAATKWDADRFTAAGALTPAFTAVLTDAKRDIHTTYNCGITALDLGLEGDIKAAQMEGTVTIAAESGKAANTVVAKYWLMKDRNGAIPTKASEINYILVSVLEAGRQVDWATGTDDAVKFSVTDPDHHDAVVANVKIEIKKNMPNAREFKWNASREPVDGVLTVYPIPSTDGATISPWNISAGTVTHGIFTLSQYTNIVAAGYNLDVWKSNAAGTGIVSVASGDVTTRLAIQRVMKASDDVTAGQAMFDKAYDAAITYPYAGVHCAYPDYLDEDGDGLTTDAVSDLAYEAPVEGLSKIKFVDALDPNVQVYTVKPYTYKTSANATVAAVTDLEKNNTSTDYFIHYPSVNLQKYSDAAVGAGNDATIPTVVNFAGDFWTLFSSNNAGNMTEGGSGALFSQATMSVTRAEQFYASDTWFTGGVRFLVKVIADGTEYYTGSIAAGTGVVTLVKKAGIVPPAADLNAQILIYAFDAFGLNTNKSSVAVPTAAAEDADLKVVATLPVKLYKN